MLGGEAAAKAGFTPEDASQVPSYTDTLKPYYLNHIVAVIIIIIRI
jgi:hypothetical protein